MRNHLHVSLAASAVLLFSGCVATQKNIGKIGGSAIGAASGAYIGKQLGGDRGALIGGLIGLGLGYMIGNEIDERRNAIKNVVKKQGDDAKVVFEDIENTKGERVGQSYAVHTPKSQFDSGKDTLNEYAEPMFVEIAKQYAKSGMKVMIVGHTDSDASSEYNQSLSERRAKTIAKLFAKHGVPEENIYYKGSGESQPIASNANEKGKAENRRVEIVEASSEEAIAQYAMNKPINAGLFPKETKVAKVPEKTTVAADHKASGIGMKAGASAGMKKLALEMSDGGSVGTPMNPDGSAPKFADLDLDGMTSKTGVPGPYSISVEHNGEELGSCHNEYAYSKMSTLEIDGEQETKGDNELIALVGAPVQSSVFSLVTPAVADDDQLAYYSSCMADHVRKSGEVKKLSTGEVVLAKENYNMAPVLNGTTWGTQVDGEFIMINPVGVLRTNMQSVSCPELNVIKKGANQPWYGTSTEIVSYNGQDGLLYRIYPADKSKIQCMDIAYPHGNPQNAEGVIYYKDESGAINAKRTKFFALKNNGESI